MKRACILAVMVGLHLSSPSHAQQPSPASPQQTAAFTLPSLPYGVEALEPAIDAQTMTLHHGKHHQAYVDALNRAVAADPTLAGQSLETLVGRAGTLSEAIRNNAGGHWNHSFFWQSMTPPGQSGQPSAALSKALDGKFGSLEAFKMAFEKAAISRFGSGWVWLIVGTNGQLAITSTPNQDNPLMDVAETKGTPLLANDIWEHAYYLKYQNRRGDYVSTWWQVVNWKLVSDRFAVVGGERK